MARVDETNRGWMMLDTTTANLLFSLLLTSGQPQFDQFGFDDEQCVFVQDDWTGFASFEEWTPLTGETAVIEDHIRELAEDVGRFADALANFRIDQKADALSESFMRRTAPAVVPKRKLARK